jgi:hypothetical protein
MKAGSALILCFLLSACASLGPSFSKPQKATKDKSLIYVYRVKKFAGSAGSPYVCLDKQVVGEIPNGGYFSFEAPPGQHELTLRGGLGDRLASFPFSSKAQQIYYVRTDFSLNSGAQENTEIARQAALGPGGGGAIGAVAGVIASDSFFGTKAEADSILARLDLRAQEKSKNPGFLFIKPDMAEPEIVQTKLVTIPTYKINPCK